MAELRDEPGDPPGVVVEFRAEGGTQKSFFIAHANHRTDCKYDNCNRQSDPMTNRQAGRQQHAEHPGVNRIAHYSIRTLGHQPVAFNQSRRHTPLLAERLSGSKSEQGRSDSERQNDCEQNDLSGHSDRNDG